MRFLEFAPTANPRDDSDGDAVPPHLHRLANLWWNGGDKQDDYRRELAALGWTLQSDADHVQLTHRNGTQYIISDDEFDGELFEISDELRRNYLHRAGRHVDRRMDHMARVRDRLNKGYEIYHADRPAGNSQIVDRFEADTPALAQQYYERFIHDYESDVDFDLRLRRATGIMELFDRPVKHEPTTSRTRQRFKTDIDGHEIQVHFTPKGDQLEVDFYVDGRGFAVQNIVKNPRKVFSAAVRTIIDRLPEAIAYYKPKTVWYKSVGLDKSRVSLYKKLLNVFQQTLGPGWTEKTFPKEGWQFYTLTRNKLDEAFDQPYPVRWEKGEFGDYDALATLDDGTHLSIMFNREEDGEYQIEFHRNHSQEVTGEGDAQRVFATVLTAIQKFIQKRHPSRIRFSATKDDDSDNQSRTKLYNRLVQRYAAQSGYSVDISDYAGSTVYELTNDLNESTVTESQQVSTADMINYIRKHHDNNLHSDYTNYITNNFTGFELRNIPVNTIKTDLPKLDSAKVEQYKKMDFSKAPPIVVGDGNILDGYHRANVAKALGIPVIQAYVGIKRVNEITKVPTIVKRKREHLDVMPNEGQPIPRGEESDYLGDLVAEMEDGFQLWSWTSHGTVTYYVFDTETRRCQLGTTGRPYSTNRDSFVIHGVYSGPKNRYRAADLYAFLIINRGLTLVSDYKQSEGGYRVWQELQQRYGRRINIHGFDTRTDEPVNVSADPEDEPDTHVDRATVKKAGPQMKKELGSISRDLRFVASAR